MNIKVVYVYPLNGAGQYFDLATRFMLGYHIFPAGIEHEVIIICNGSPVTDEARFLFSSIPNVRFLEHDNSGYDCGAFQHAARENPCDLMVFFGATAYLKGPGWLSRMAESFQRRGHALYGSMGNRGDARIGVYPHIRTTGMWMPPSLLNQYPHIISKPDQRYPFEHGPDCLTSWVRRKGFIPWVVAWSGEYSWEQWDSFPNGYQRGNQSNLISGDKNSCPPYYHCA